MTAAFVAAVPIAALLDGWHVPMSGALPSGLWLGLAGAGCLAWAALQPGAWQDRERWSTPFDGLVLATLALATLAAWNDRIAGGGTHLLTQAVACSAALYGLAFVLRRTPGTAEFAWRAIALTAAALGAHFLWGLAGGFGALAHSARWGQPGATGDPELARTLVFATLVTAGRACERYAPAPWRAAVLVGALGLAARAATGGIATGPLSLARLDAPMDFSAACLTWLLASALSGRAWALRKERPGEAWRWRMLAGATAGFGVASVFGDAAGGEGVCALAVLAAVAVLGSPAEAEVPLEVATEEEEPLDMAA